MTALLEKAFATVRTFSAERQDEVARILLQLADVDEAVYHLTREEEADLDAADAEIERGEFASDDEIRAIWAKHGL